MAKKGRHLHQTDKRPIAAVYRGPVACEGCAESVATLLRKSPSHYKVHYLGPNETHDVSRETLSHLDLFAWPGGGDDQAKDYLTVAHYTTHLQHFVKEGGMYAGFCMGAFLARGPGEETFFGLLPNGSYVSGERFEKGAQVKGAEDTIILTDWTFHTGHKKGTEEKDRWQYFQDGGFVHLGQDVPKETLVLGHYTYTNDVCATVTPFGKGHVGLIGVHPEADASWYEDWHGHNPQGIHHDIGYDFVETLGHAHKIAKEVEDGHFHVTKVKDIPKGNSTAPTQK